jgi:hypothetical protein
MGQFSQHDERARFLSSYFYHFQLEDAPTTVASRNQNVNLKLAHAEYGDLLRIKCEPDKHSEDSRKHEIEVCNKVIL